MAFNYTRTEKVQHIQNNIARVKIIGAENTVSKAGTEMIKLRLKISNSRIQINYYILNNEYANDKLTRLYDSFVKIPEGNLDLDKWLGEIGVARLKKNDREFWEIAAFLTPDNGADLPDYIDIPVENEPKPLIEVETTGDLPF